MFENFQSAQNGMVKTSWVPQNWKYAVHSEIAGTYIN